MGDNPYLYGSFPDRLSTLPNLKKMYRVNMNLTGTIPADIANLTGMTDFRVG